MPLRPHDRRLKSSRRLDDAARTALAKAILSGTINEAAHQFGCTPKALVAFAKQEGFAHLLPTLQQPKIAALDGQQRTALTIAVQQGKSINALARLAGGVTRQAIFQWLERTGQLDFWRDQRAAQILTAQAVRAARQFDATTPEAIRLLRAAEILAARGYTVACAPRADRRSHTPAQLYADAHPVRFVRPALVAAYYRFNAVNPNAIYVAILPDRWCIFVPPYGGQTVYIRTDRAMRHRITGVDPAWVVEVEAA